MTSGLAAAANYRFPSLVQAAVGSVFSVRKPRDAVAGTGEWPEDHGQAELGRAQFLSPPFFPLTSSLHGRGVGVGLASLAGSL